MFLIAVLGILCYLCVVAVSSVGIALAPVASRGQVARLLGVNRITVRFIRKKNENSREGIGNS